MKFNIHSLIIYLGLLVVVLSDIAQGKAGFSLGIITAMLIIYFFLADKQQQKNIRDNLLFKVRNGSEEQ